MTRLTSLATVVDCGDRWLTIESENLQSLGHVDMYFDAPPPAWLAALYGQRGALRVVVESALKTPLRSAEEIAREMVVDAGWLQLGTDGVRLASDVSVPHARAIIARLIEQSRADGAAAARGREVLCDACGGVK